MGDPRPQCNECGIPLHPKDDVKFVYEPGEDIPKGMALQCGWTDIFVGIYCSSDCILDAIARGWPEHRGMTIGLRD